MKEFHLRTEGEKIDILIEHTMQLINKNRLMPDWRGTWFSNKMLDTIRRILEKRGLRSAQTYLLGKLDPRGSHTEKSKNRIILDLLEEVESLDLDTKMASYIIGKLNFIVNEKKGRAIS